VRGRIREVPGRIRAVPGRVRADWAQIRRWVLARRLLLPALVAAGSVDMVREQPWLGAGAAAAVVALLARFTFPTAALLLAVVVTATTPPPVTLLLLPVMAFAAARRIAFPGRVSTVFAVAAAALGVIVAVKVEPASAGTVALVVAATVGVGLLLPAAVGALVGERARRLEMLRERAAVLERAQRLGDEQARMQERARIAGEMHDLLGHRLSLISLHAGALELGTRRESPELSEQAALVRTTARKALDELREVLGILRVEAARPEVDGHGDEAGTRADVWALVLASQRAGVPVELDWSGPDLTGVDVRVRRALHRVVREALTNVHKHAPGATTRVLVEHASEAVRAEVDNDLPPGGHPAGAGTRMGLVGLEERVRLAGGTFHAGASTDGTRFVVSATLPLAATPGGDSSSIDHPGVADRQTPPARSAADTGSPIGSPTQGSTPDMRKPTKPLLYVLLGVLVVCGGGALTVGWFLAREVRSATIPAATFRAVQTGQSEDQVRRQIGETGTIGRETLSGEEPPIPAGAQCAYGLSEGVDKNVYRFCFAGGKLVEKREIKQPEAGTGQ
jgi:signal transduction histidine kinase